MRIIIMIFAIFSSLFATDISAQYKVTFGIFGEIGIAKTNLHVNDDNSYKITVHAKSTGLANALSGQREEWYVSVGKVDKKGILVPDYYEKTVQRYSRKVTLNADSLILKKDIKKYIFSHDTKELKLEITRYRNDKVSHEVKKGDYYAPNDLLSLFFNFKKMLPSLVVTKASKFYAVGANKKDGRIDIQPLKNEKKIKKELEWRDGHMMKVVINDKIFASKKGELLINLQDDGLCLDAVLKDVIFFGDIRGTKID
ncbi:DUF3108 domain-containing protein [Sulfurospirillum arcachonense]|uniref:DUF3108 domain-containing protein n=1 Tax=Sulfurospirillum arcachonense TaxID=57666 RepID=UPI00046930B8|nr:DUF3108 domain-containing protein [Sulfurospirillum arcachonense]